MPRIEINVTTNDKASHPLAGEVASLIRAHMPGHIIGESCRPGAHDVVLEVTQDQVKAELNEPPETRAQLLGCRLYTDDPRLYTACSLSGDGTDNLVTAEDVDSIMPGVIQACVAARQELEEKRFKAEELFVFEGEVCAMTSLRYGRRHSSWIQVRASDRLRDMKDVDVVIEAIAAACHQQNRVWCLAHHDESQLPWSEAPQWAKDSAIEGVRGALGGNTPEQSHQGWLDLKTYEGWSYGPEKNVALKTHPCMVPYSDLDETQKRKDEFYVLMVRELGGLFGLISNKDDD